MIKNIAPNGEVSNLTPKQYKLVRTESFKKWFGDWENDPENSSKVIDENGEPLVVYHGSDSKFNVFKESDYIGTHGETDQIIGMYFTSKKEVAEWYTHSDKLVKEVFLNIKSPLVSNDNKSLKKRLKVSTLSKVNEASKILGYSGVIIIKGFHTLGIQMLYLAFNSNQIKLADGTNTDFDEDNEDIRFEDGGEIKPYSGWKLNYLKWWK